MAVLPYRENFMIRKSAKTGYWKWLLALCVCGMCCAEVPAAELQGCIARDNEKTSVVTDMAGRKVTVPRNISHIATIGAVPVINSYLFALGEGSKIVNGLPHFARSNRWRLQTAIAPQLVNLPILQGQDRQVNVEALLRLCPDIIITMDLMTVKALEKNRIRIPILYLEWRNTSEIKANMRVLGVTLDRTSRSNEYLRYFESRMTGVRGALKGISKTSMPKVLYFDPNTLNTPLLIADWWIREAGGQSVTAEIKRSGNISYSHEQVLKWNPDIMIVSAPHQIACVYKDKRLSGVNAVLNKRVYAMPIGTHSWGQRTVEQPLTVLWAAKLFHPEKFGNTDLVAESKYFYRKFFGYSLSDKEAVWMLNGGSGS
jgi:iron complex transport system substrate-binding protein